jgi:hypothetical protein
MLQLGDRRTGLGRRRPGRAAGRTLIGHGTRPVRQPTPEEPDCSSWRIKDGSPRGLTGSECLRPRQRRTSGR